MFPRLFTQRLINGYNLEFSKSNMENESLKPKMGGTKIFALRVARPVASLAMLLGVILIFDFCIFNSVQAATIAKPSNFLTMNTGLVGYWTFDGPKMTQNVADSSGQGNTGYLFGQISTTSAQGKIGQALYFDGTDDRISVSGSLTIGAWPYTYCAWVKPQDSGHVFDNIISNLGLSFILIDVDAGDSYYNLYNNASGNLNSAAGSVVFDKWQHVCGIAYANDTASFYIDGTLSVGPSAFQSNQFTDYPVYIGAGTSDPTSGNFKGNIDDVRIYNKALSATEVLQLYNLGR